MKRISKLGLALAGIIVAGSFIPALAAAPKYKVGSVFNNKILNTKSKMYILDYKKGDVTGDKIADEILLVGSSKPRSHNENVKLIIKNGKNGKFTKIDMTDAESGYEPKLFLGDIDANTVNDIMVSAESGGSGGTSFYELYSFNNSQVQKLDYKSLIKEQMDYTVVFKDGFKVEVTNKSTKKLYTIDVSKKKKYYTDMQMYDESGKVISEFSEGWVDTDVIIPVKNANNTYSLKVHQTINGSCNADDIGEAITYLNYANGKFNIVSAEVKPY